MLFFCKGKIYIFRVYTNKQMVAEGYHRMGLHDKGAGGGVGVVWLDSMDNHMEGTISQHIHIRGRRILDEFWTLLTPFEIGSSWLGCL